MLRSPPFNWSKWANPGFSTSAVPTIDRVQFARRLAESFGLDTSLINAKPTSNLPRPLPDRLRAGLLDSSTRPGAARRDAAVGSITRRLQIPPGECSGLGSSLPMTAFARCRKLRSTPGMFWGYLHGRMSIATPQFHQNTLPRFPVFPLPYGMNRRSRFAGHRDCSGGQG